MEKENFVHFIFDEKAAKAKHVRYDDITRYVFTELQFEYTYLCLCNGGMDMDKKTFPRLLLCNKRIRHGICVHILLASLIISYNFRCMLKFLNVNAAPFTRCDR